VYDQDHLDKQSLSHRIARRDDVTSVVKRCNWKRASRSVRDAKFV